MQDLIYNSLQRLSFPAQLTLLSEGLLRVLSTVGGAPACAE